MDALHHFCFKGEELVYLPILLSIVPWRILIYFGVVAVYTSRLRFLVAATTNTQNGFYYNHVPPKVLPASLEKSYNVFLGHIQPLGLVACFIIL